MSKGIELSESQIKAYENGATIFLFFANKYRIESEFDKCIFPIKKRDKDIFIKEDRYENADGSFYFNTIKTDDFNWYPASLMTQKQSRYSFKECIDVQIIRPDSIARTGYFDGADLKEEILKGLGLKWIGYMSRENYEEIGFKLFVDFYNQQLKEQKINRTYNDNDYIFLVKFER